MTCADGILTGTRRRWLRFASAGMLAGWLGSRPFLGVADRGTVSSPGFGKAKSVLLIYASGGQSHIDMWDPKPTAPANVRGEFATVATAVPGLQFTDRLPALGKIADKFTVLRSMSHADLDHGSASYLTLTGRYHERLSSNPPVQATDLPTYGAVLRKLKSRQTFPYESIHVNGPALVPFEPAPGQYGGILGRKYEPLLLGDVSKELFAMPALNPRESLTKPRLSARLGLKESLERGNRVMERHQRVADASEQYRQALEVLGSDKCRNAFNIGQEKRRTREQYGLHRPGQACLLARRLLEAGVPLVTVIWNHSNRGQDRYPADTAEYGWDTHNDIFESLKVHLCPRFDSTMATLLSDLDERGLLDETLVVCMGEFGRAPKVAVESNFAGSAPGRKHWAAAYSLLLAGAGVQRGAVVGRSDRLGAEVVTRRYAPWDIAATMFAALGIDPAGHYRDELNRPYPISIGRPIDEIYG